MITTEDTKGTEKSGKNRFKFDLSKLPYNLGLIYQKEAFL